VLSSRRRRSRRITSTVVVGSLAVSLAFVAGAAAAQKKPKVKINKACTMLIEKKVAKAFGAPVVIASDSFGGPLGCTASVGTDPAVPPGGRLVAYQEYPNLDIFDARNAVNDRRAAESLANDLIEDVDGIGKLAYLNRTIGVIVVQASKKYAFSLLWQRAGATGLSDADAKNLLDLAKDVVARSPR